MFLIIGVVVWAIFQAWPREGKPILNMRLGLDLKGGSHLVYRVVTEDAIKDEASVMATRISALLRTDGGYVTADARVADDAPGEVVVDGIPSDRIADARNFLEQELGVWQIASQAGGVRLRMPSSEQEAVRERAVKQVLSTLRNRIDELGVAEPIIQRAGAGQSDRIIVQLPGVEDPTRVKDIINQKGRLEKRLLYYRPDGSGPFTATNEADLLSALGGVIPPGVELLPGKLTSNEDALPELVIAVERTAAITGGDLQDARPQTGEWGDTVVGFTLRIAAADRFAKFTRENIGRQMAIVLDGRVQSAPTINGEISTQGQIEWGFTYDDAERLSLILRAGALPAGIVTLEERTVGPSLGRDSIVSGIRAAALGFALVLIFMVIYYKLSGVVAIIALVLNLLLVAAVMASLDATLTLPGIGGFVLTVGMAVDANVLIFERVREEMRAGKTVKGALDGGFSKALSAIVDANVTTLIAAFFLFQYGTGPVRGFAVTLFIGILASMFTAIFVSRTVFDAVLGDRAVRRLSI